MATAPPDVFRVVDDSVAGGGQGVRGAAGLRLHQRDGCGRQGDDGNPIVSHTALG